MFTNPKPPVTILVRLDNQSWGIYTPYFHNNQFGTPREMVLGRKNPFFWRQFGPIFSWYVSFRAFYQTKNAKLPQWNDALKMQNPRYCMCCYTISSHTRQGPMNFPWWPIISPLKIGKEIKKACKHPEKKTTTFGLPWVPLNAWNQSVVWIQLARFLGVFCFIHCHPHPYPCVPTTILFWSRFGKEQTPPSQDKKHLWKPGAFEKPL